jgi:hypothetical protein
MFYHNTMVYSQVADRGEGLQIWTAVASILNKQLLTLIEECPSA